MELDKAETIVHEESPMNIEREQIIPTKKKRGFTKAATIELKMVPNIKTNNNQRQSKDDEPTPTTKNPFEVSSDHFNVSTNRISGIDEESKEEIPDYLK